MRLYEWVSGWVGVFVCVCVCGCAYLCGYNFLRSREEFKRENQKKKNVRTCMTLSMSSPQANMSQRNTPPVRHCLSKKPRPRPLPTSEDMITSRIEGTLSLLRDLICFVIKCYVMLCHVISCYVKSYIMPCYIMLCYIMQCYITFVISCLVQIQTILFHAFS